MLKWTPDRGLLIAVSDSASRQIVRRHFNAYSVADKNANSVLAHFTGDRSEHDVLRIVELDLEECVGLLINDSAFCGNQIVSSQIVSPFSFKFKVPTFRVGVSSS